jgi:hypothetical protein
VTGLPPGLEDFGERLQQAAERDVAKRRPERRRGRWTRSIGLPVAAAVVAAAVSAGAVRVVDRGGDPIEPEAGGNAVLAPAKDPTVVSASAAANPSGGPPWVLRVYTSASSRECAQIGRLRDGVFGQVQLAKFRPLPSSASGTCAHADERGPLVAVSRLPGQSLTIVFGLAVDRSPVTVRFGGRERRVRPVGFGAFIAVFEGVDRHAKIVVRSKVGGRADERRL